MDITTLSGEARTGKVQALAGAFADVLVEWLGDEEFAEMKATNATPEYAGSDMCASHDYCDANMAMDAAWKRVIGRSPEVSWETKPDGTAVDPEAERLALADCDMWNDAWKVAKAGWLTATEA